MCISLGRANEGSSNSGVKRGQKNSKKNVPNLFVSAAKRNKITKLFSPWVFQITTEKDNVLNVIKPSANIKQFGEVFRKNDFVSIRVTRSRSNFASLPECKLYRCGPIYIENFFTLSGLRTMAFSSTLSDVDIPEEDVFTCLFKDVDNYEDKIAFVRDSVSFR